MDIKKYRTSLPVLGQKTASIAHEVLDERINQEEKWGTQDHDPSYWMVILMEEVGEACHEICGKGKDYKAHRQELIQVAAVAFAAIESLDRNGYGHKQ